MSAIAPPGIFISYRRQDTAPYARMLKFQLDECVPDTPVFMDLDSIEPGLDFTEAIEFALQSCVALVALIGPQWLKASDSEGRCRLDDPEDLVRFEIRTAIEREIRVIPVLIDGAAMPRQQQLPACLHRLARLSALEMSYGRLAYDETRLITVLQKVLNE
jgi:hypothetical protein